MQKHEPDLWKRVKKIMLPKDYLAYRLSGTFCTDYSDASGMLLLDVEHRAWSEQMLEICHVEREQPGRSVRGDATCRLERAARSLSPVKSLVWTHTMPCIPLITRMAVII